MAKKGQPVQLQAEINNDEEWEKLLQKDGLIVVDVYSKWCGPCQGMAANLKKLKLEIGGDMLHLAAARSDTITPLQRLKNKSEPTWMLISKGKMVNLMFGANAPKLTRMIIDELKIEQSIMEGEKKQRNIFWEITDLSPDEQIRYDAAQTTERIAREKEETKRSREIHERKTMECENIIANLPGHGVILILPNAKSKYQEVLTDLISEAGLYITQTEKVKLTEDMIEELLFFSQNKFSDMSKNDLLSNKISIVLLLKRSTENLPGDIDEIVLQVVYGNMRQPPGDDKSPSKELMTMEFEESHETILDGIWAPPNQNTKAIALKLFFHNLSNPFKLPENLPSPFYIVLGYDAFKTRDILQLSLKYADQMKNYGFFTSDIPPEAQLISKTLEAFENRAGIPTYEEKIVIQLATTNPACVGAFIELGPSYMSSDVEVGERDCNFFFPPSYNIQDTEVQEVRKKPKKKLKIKSTTTTYPEETTSVATSDLTKEQSEIDHDEILEQESDEEKPLITFDDNEDRIFGADKATSPIDHNTED